MDREAGKQTVQIDVTIVLPRRVAWLLAGVAIGNLGALPDALLERAVQLVRSVLTG